jgi:hypothetical protein
LQAVVIGTSLVARGSCNVLAPAPFALACQDVVICQDVVVNGLSMGIGSKWWFF